MKKSIIILLLSFTTLFLQSQNWQPIKTNDTLNYINSENQIISIWVDSISVNNNDTTYYLNQSSFYNCFYHKMIINPFFLLKQLVQSENGSFSFQDSLKYQFEPNIQLNNTHVYDSLNNITSQLISISDSIIFGFQDSVKIFRLSTNDTIILSKSFGILQLPSYYTYRYGYYYHDVADVYTLIGKENGSLGVTIPKKNNWLSYQIDDVIQYRIKDGSYDFHNSTEYRTLKTITIIDDIVQDKEYLANIHEFTYKFWEGYDNIEYYSDSTERNYIDTVFFNKERYDLSAFTGQMGAIESDTIRNYYHTEVSYNTDYDRIMKTFIDENSLVFKRSLKNTSNISNQKYYSALTNKHYIKGLGLIKSTLSTDYGNTMYDSYTITLNGYVHNGDTLGTVDFPLSTNSIEYFPSILVYPNPTNDLLYIKMDEIQTMDVAIILRDQFGRPLETIHKANTYSKEYQLIHLKNYPTGIYFLEVRNLGNDQVQSIKVIKN